MVTLVDMDESLFLCRAGLHVYRVPISHHLRSLAEYTMSQIVMIRIQSAKDDGEETHTSERR